MTGLLTLREALARPLRKPAVRKLVIGQAVSVGTEPPVPLTRWFVLQPRRRDEDLNAAAIPCTSFDAALETLRRISR